jgi:hypothetical protein
MQNFRAALSAKLEKVNLEIQGLQLGILAANEQLDKNNNRWLELQAEMRFYEARILKYESLLTG